MSAKRLNLSDLTPAALLRIGDAYTEGVTIGELCLRFNISRDTLRAVLAFVKPAEPIRGMYIWPSSRKRKTTCTMGD